MNGKSVVATTLVIFSTICCRAQSSGAVSENVPIYRVTVIERTVRAVNYQYRTGPTRVDFRGTVLLPMAKGDASVESKRGRTEVDAKLDHLPPPTRFGREYLTYVLWAITPEGHARSLGELLANGSDKAKLHVTTDLQAFGLIVTAEPYSAVRQPSDVVVAENEIRPDTMGTSEPIQAKYELLPRGHYTYHVPSDLIAAEAGAPKLPFDEYESLVEVYQAQNAVQIAQAAGADRYVPDIFAKAEQLLHDAQAMQARHAGVSMTVTTARKAAQTADDARTIALKRSQDAELAQAREQAAATEAKLDEERTARREAEAQAQAAKARAEQAEADRQAVEAPPPPPQVTVPAPIQEPQRSDQVPPAAEAAQREARQRLQQELNTVLPTRDTPRGLVATLPDTYFHLSSLDPAVYARLSRVASILRAQPGLTVEIEGHTDDRGDPAYLDRLSLERANAIRGILVRQGVPEGETIARGFGKSRPIGPNATAAEREQNRRVEIVISGAAIGNAPSWDRSYPLTPGR